jgi:hypothetical protein
MGSGLRLERLVTSATEVGNQCDREWQGRDVVEWNVTPGERYEIQAERSALTGRLAVLHAGE